MPTLAADPFLLYFSSGTSGNPKMVLHDSGYALAHIVTAKHWHNVVSDGGLHFTIADTGWGKAVWGKYYGQWTMEACVFTYDFDRFDPAEILILIEKYRISTLCCPPTMYRLMMQAGVDGYDLSCLSYCTTAGEALNPDLFEGWRATPHGPMRTATTGTWAATTTSSRTQATASGRSKWRACSSSTTLCVSAP